MRSIGALIRAAALSAASYRLGFVMTVVGLIATVVPLYFVSGALQPVIQESIRTEGGDYFGFLIVGFAASYLLTSAASAIPSALAGSIGSGTFEALLVTRTSVPMLLMGMSGYPLLQSLIRAALLVGGAALIGVNVAWDVMPVVLAVLALMVVAYAAIGLIAASFVLVFRTSGPLITAVVASSSLLGGIYYPTTAIPGWLQSLSGVVPLTYALRAMRMLLLGGATLADTGADIAILALIAVVGLSLSALTFSVALRYARTAGTLSQY